MRRHPAWAFLVLLALTAAGCAALTAPRYRSIEDAGQTVPPDQVLLVGKIELDPPVKQAQTVGIDVMDVKGTINLALTRDLSQPVDLDSLFIVAPEEMLMAENARTSFIPVPPGDRYIRIGQFIISERCSVVAIGPQGGCRAIDMEQLLLVGDVRLSVPAGSQAVYVGTIVYEHDGQFVRRIRVRDDFAAAQRDLTNADIPGIDPGSMVRRLAEVVGTR